MVATMRSSSLFTALNLIGEGSQAKVFSALDQTGQQVAIKVYETENLGCFQEARILERIKKLELQHSPKIHCSFVERNKLFIVTDFCPGVELHNHLTSNCLLFSEVRTIFRKILIAVSELHENNICHLDLKIENIIYDTRNKKIKLIDFGFSQFTEENNQNKLIKRFCGSIHYSSPEIVQNVPFDGKKADIWALGVILFVLIAERFPFVGDGNDSVTSVAYQILTQQIPFDSQFNNLGINIISIMMGRLPERRPSLKSLLQHPFFL